LVSNGGSIDSVEKCHNIKLTMGKYNLEIPMYAMCISCLWVQWLRTLDTISTNYNKIFMGFELEGIQYELKGLKSISSQVTISHRMEKLLKNDSKGVVVKIYSI